MGIIYDIVSKMTENDKCKDCSNKVEVTEKGKKATVVIDKERCACCERGE